MGFVKIFNQELLEEVCALKNNVLNYGDNLDKRGLMESIKDIRDRLMYRIEIEENKRDEVIESLDHLKREFAKTQEEIFYLRSKRQPNFKEDIQQRVQKEKELSYSICAAQQERRRICSQHDVLMKALVTLKKICGSS